MINLFEAAFVAEGIYKGKHSRHVGQLCTISSGIAHEFKYSLTIKPFPLAVTTPSREEVLPLSTEDIEAVKQLIGCGDLAVAYCLLQFGWVCPEDLGINDPAVTFSQH